MPSTTPNPVAPRPRARGGSRPGAGAPRGNLNALRSGARSARVNALYASVPPSVRLHVAVALAWAIATELATPGVRPGAGAAGTHALARVAACLATVDWTQADSSAALRQVAVLALAPVFSTAPPTPRAHAKTIKTIKRRIARNALS